MPREVFTQLFNLWNQRGAAEEKDSGSECWLDSQQVVTNALLKVIWSHNWSALGPDLLIPSFEIFLLRPLIDFFLLACFGEWKSSNTTLFIKADHSHGRIWKNEFGIDLKTCCWPVLTVLEDTMQASEKENS